MCFKWFNFIFKVINKHRINPKTNGCFQEHIKERIKKTKEDKKNDLGENLKKLTMYEFIKKFEDENNNDNYFCKIFNFIYESFVKEED